MNKERLLVVRLILIFLVTLLIVGLVADFRSMNQTYNELQQSYNQLEMQLAQTEDELAWERTRIVVCGELRNFICLEELEQFLAEDKTDELEYIKGVFDCDDFAMQLQRNALAQGYLMNTQMLFTQHMMNMCVAGDSVYYIEATTDKIMFVNYC